MPEISINNMNLEYNENAVIDFTEGLIGLPEMRRAVIVPMSDYSPFCWLASVDDERNRFVVVAPSAVFPDYSPDLPEELRESPLETLAIVKISSNWENTTINLRAPIFINSATKRGAQVILSETKYRLAEALPTA
ncbi:MAG: flagellar assembly protein FliW [Pyrinomonadaceae bacterium]|nr:flagellar assembly protein FliW [Pyrinomonadaceae bacterium]